MNSQLVRIPADEVHIEGLLELPAEAQGIVLFAHGSGSSRHSPRNNYVARVLHDKGFGTLLLDLLTLAEDLDYQTRSLPIAYFGASTGAAAALQAAAALGREIHAIVSRGGRPDLAGTHDLTKVMTPTLLLVGSRDEEVLELNRAAYSRLPCTKKLSLIAGATHLFEEAGALEDVADQTAAWFSQYLTA